MDRLVEALRRFVERYVRRSVRDIPTEATVREAARALADLDEALSSTAAAERLGGIREVLAGRFLIAAGEFTDTTGLKAPLGGFARRSLEALADDRLDMASRTIRNYLGDVRSAVLDSVVLGKRPDPDAIIDNLGDAAFRHVKTELNTAGMAFQRLTHIKKAEKAGITKFLYVGPDDERTRPFCAEHVDRVYSLEEIRAMDNGQGLPVEVYGGGYNCRHHWRPISDELADEIMTERNAEADPS